MKDIKTFLIGFLTSVCMFLIMGQTNKNLGDIEVNSIIVKGNNGETAVEIGSIEAGGFIYVFNNEGIIVSAMDVTDNGGGRLGTNNPNGEKNVFLGTDVEGGSQLLTYNENGEQTVFLGASKSGNGLLRIYNKHGVEAGYFGPDKNQDGLVALFDRYGDRGWSATGKQ